MANTNTKKATATDEKLESVANNEAVAAKPKKKERTMDNESENVKAWLNDRDDDDLGGSAYMF